MHRGQELLPQSLSADMFYFPGGTLRVKHRGQAKDFAWEDLNPQSIQWAAFYGDCEHEVMEVTRGHRVTLTYNLYYSSIGNLAQPVSNPEKLPLFDTVRNMLHVPQFMEKGNSILINRGMQVLISCRWSARLLLPSPIRALAPGRP